jgi:transcription elongation factor SPT5
LASLVPKGSVPNAAKVDASKMNPALAGGAIGSGVIGRGPRDRLIGVTVTVVQGNFKGLIGIIKETFPPKNPLSPKPEEREAQARVEISSKNKVITILQNKLKRRK